MRIVCTKKLDIVYHQEITNIASINTSMCFTLAFIVFDEFSGICVDLECNVSPFHVVMSGDATKSKESRIGPS